MDALAATGGCDTGAAIGEGLVGTPFGCLVGEGERAVKWREGCRERFNTRRGVATYPVVGASGPIHPPGLQRLLQAPVPLRPGSPQPHLPVPGPRGDFDLDADPTS